MLAGSEAIVAAVEADAQRVRARTLQPGCAALFDPTIEGTPSGVALMLHGWSAGAWQFAPLAAALRARGLYTYAARLPGHGACHPEEAAADAGNAAGKEDDRELPLSGQWQQYRDCADAALAASHTLAQAHGLPLFIVGFSGGGALATDLLLRHPDKFSRAVLVAPLLRPRALQHRFLFRALNTVPGAGWCTDHIGVSWGDLPVTPPGGWVRPGHWFFKLGALQSIVRYSEEVWQHAAALRTPTQFIVTDLDDKADPRAAEILRGKGSTTHHLWRFAASDAVPHAMLTAEENPNAPTRARIFEMVARFLLRGEGANSAS